MFEAGGTASAKIEIDPVATTRAELRDRRFRARGKTIVAFVAIAAGKTATGFVERFGL